MLSIFLPFFTFYAVRPSTTWGDSPQGDPTPPPPRLMDACRPRFSLSLTAGIPSLPHSPKRAMPPPPPRTQAGRKAASLPAVFLCIWGALAALCSWVACPHLGLTLPPFLHHLFLLFLGGFASCTTAAKPNRFCQWEAASQLAGLGAHPVLPIGEGDANWRAAGAAPLKGEHGRDVFPTGSSLSDAMQHR